MKFEMVSVVNQLSDPVLALLQETGRIFVLLGQMISASYHALRQPERFRRFYYRILLEQMSGTGVSSIPVVITTALFTGMVLALQTGVTMEAKIKGSSAFIGNIVNLALVRELGPVLTAILVTGRIGSAMAAEVGTMQVTEQVDALRTLAANPIEYLAMPRFLAVLIMLPLLTVLADVTGSLGGWLVSSFHLGISSHTYWNGAFSSVHLEDFMTGFIKSFFYAVILTTFALHRGFATRGGAEGVGHSTTGAVVNASITILIADYFLSQLFALF
jgi:phospholipid/cholesterol/gamma-HCH transport system permease protein